MVHSGSRCNWAFLQRSVSNSLHTCRWLLDNGGSRPPESAQQIWLAFSIYRTMPRVDLNTALLTQSKPPLAAAESFRSSSILWGNFSRSEPFSVSQEFGKRAIKCFFRVFHSLYKTGRNGIIVFKGFNNRKKSYLQWGSTWCYRLLLV